MKKKHEKPSVQRSIDVVNVLGYCVAYSDEVLAHMPSHSVYVAYSQTIHSCRIAKTIDD